MQTVTAKSGYRLCDFNERVDRAINTGGGRDRMNACLTAVEVSRSFPLTYHGWL
jgi:hypothetical protein